METVPPAATRRNRQAARPRDAITESSRNVTSTDANSASQSSGAEEPTFEQALGQLEEIVHELEDGRIGLSEALARYEQGVKLLKRCYGLLERAERRVELLTRVDAEGTATTEPFDEGGEQSLDEKAAARSRRRSKKADTAASKTPRTTKTAEVDEPPGLF